MKATDERKRSCVVLIEGTETDVRSSEVESGDEVTSQLTQLY